MAIFDCYYACIIPTPTLSFEVSPRYGGATMEAADRHPIGRRSGLDVLQVVLMFNIRFTGCGDLWSRLASSRPFSAHTAVDVAPNMTYELPKLGTA